MKNLTWQNPEQLFVAQVLINKVKSKCCGIKDKESYLYSGMENIDFYGWGPEDYERYLRWKKLGLKMSRVDGPLFHLSHERGSDSRMRSSIQAMSTNDEIRKLMNMTKEELLLDIENRNERWNELVQDINQSE